MTITQDLLINGVWEKPGGHTPVLSPWDQRVVGYYADGDAGDATRAVDGAAAALQRGLHPDERADILRAASLLIVERGEELSHSISREAGKPLSLARIEVSRAAEVFRFGADAARNLPAEAVPVDATASGRNHLAFTVAQPIGVVAAITPFNFPINTVAHKVSPALAAGCPVVLKPSEKTPLTAGLLAKVLSDAGLPAGWFSIVTGNPEAIVNAWSEDDRVAAITFTGSSQIGWKLKAASPRKHHTMELGSATAMYIAADADVPAAAAAAARSAFGFSGQVCLSLQRLYVDKAVFGAVVEELKSHAEAMVIGDPADPATDLGPMITAAASERVLSWISDAEGSGATIVTGGKMKGPVLQPTVITGVQNSARIVCNEVFGPVVSVMVVDGVDEAIENINAVPYGLNTSIYTADLATAIAFGRRAEAGQAIVNDAPNFRTENMPYGGVKQSGQGREGVSFATAEFTRQKLIVINA